MSIRVAFDMSAAITGSTGIARYQIELSRALERSGVGVCRFAFGRANRPLPAGTRHIGIPGRLLYPAWRWLGLPPSRAYAPGADVIHTGAPVIPRTRRPVVATVHDLDALDRPDLHPPRSGEQLASMLATLHRARAVIAVSEHVASVLRERGIPADRIHVVHHGVPPLAEPDSVDTKEPYLLAVGQLMARKGFDGLMRAFARSTAVGSGIRLLIVGPPGPDADRLHRIRAELGLADQVTFAGAVSDGHLAGLYRSAAAVCLPSLAEGFGLPVLEALSAGAPLLCSDLPVLREVSGGHAVFAPPGDEGAWAAAIDRVVSDDALTGRLRAAGPEWTERFTWEAAAEATVAAYAAALGTTRRAAKGSSSRLP